jgi:hypothetical protein
MQWQDRALMIPNTMNVMVLAGHGGIDTLGHQKVSTPQPAPVQVLGSVGVFTKGMTVQKFANKLKTEPLIAYEPNNGAVIARSQ